jgi:hypothetical protein
MEPFYPMRALVCRACLLVQLKAYGTAKLSLVGLTVVFSLSLEPRPPARITAFTTLARPPA